VSGDVAALRPWFADSSREPTTYKIEKQSALTNNAKYEGGGDQTSSAIGRFNIVRLLP
jgi:hypothetical protein